MAGQTWYGIELRHLRYFLAVAEELNYGKAALRLGIAQPGLSQQIKALETRVGTDLFDRSRRAIRLTLAGELFVAEARQALSHVDQGVLLAQRASRGELGHVRIGYVGSAAYSGVLTTLVGEFRDQRPHVRLEIAEMEMSCQLEQLRQGQLDVAFIRPPVELPAGLLTVSVLHEEVCLVLPAGHPLAQGADVALAGCRDEIFITPQHEPGVSFHHHTLAACQAAGFHPQLGPQARDFMTIASMVSVGLGIGLVPRSVECIRLPGIRYKPLRGMRIQAELAVAFRQGESSPAIQAFAQHAHGLIERSEAATAVS